ncbi:mechanosensitive ion channel family protein [Edaphobacter bradus]|uniref:mechanosensitive ion channel family protein n=1 Tax=Edaphobacter bradus TaxID=2259016 RepID=UPI0021DF4734|nr:mechanosensitive ion channel family protein [Edaphobacter bradus]
MPTTGTMMRKSMPRTNFVRTGCSLCACLLLLGILCCDSAPAQPGIPSPAQNAKPEVPQDTLGRTTPRGAVLGFLSAAGKNDNETAARYLNTRLKGEPAAELARQLFVVLNRRLPANLNQLSNRPEGSQADPLHPNLELIGTIPSSEGNVEILLERLDRKEAGSLWLFSRGTLDSIPGLYKEINTQSVEKILPEFLTKRKVGPIPLFQLLAIFVGMPSLYLLTGLLNRVLSHIVGLLRRRLRKKPDLPDPDVLPRPIRLLVLVFVIRWTLSHFSFPLLQRQFWSIAATVITIAAIVWLFIILNGWVEQLIHHRLMRHRYTGASAILRLGRRMVDILAIFVGVLTGLYYFGLNPTAALAGLGVGGIAVALAAQKTLENLIGGTSIILDRVVRVGDMVKIGDAFGAVEDVGLRSTRIRTLDRTVVSVPNGQIANASLENITMRDKFWFHQNLNLHKETTGSQMRSFVEGVTNLLAQNPAVERDSFRVSFLCLGTFSLDVELFAYVFARGWPHFLQIQEELLLQIMELLQSAGIQMAVQPHAVSLPAPTTSDGDRPQALATNPNP